MAEEAEGSEQEQEGVVRSAVVAVVCVGCAGELTAQLDEDGAPQKPGDMAELYVRCQACSERTGEDQIIPLLILSGSQVWLTDDAVKLIDWLKGKHPAVLDQFLEEHKEEEPAEAAAEEAPAAQLPAHEPPTT